MTRSRTTFLCAAALSWLVAGCTGSQEEKETETITVIAAPVQTASFTETVRGVGTCAPLVNLLAAVTPAVDGAVAQVLVAAGDEVKAGQPLVRLDDRLAAQDLAEKKAAKAELESSLVLLKAPPREPDRRAAEADVERAKLAVDLSHAVVTRLEPLNQRKEISDQQLFEAKQKLEDATLGAKIAQAKLDLLLAGARPEAIAEAEAKVARAEVAVASGTARLAYFTLTSPLAGTVDAIHCHPGQILVPGTVAVEVIDTSSLIATISVPASDASKLKPGQSAKVMTGDGSDTEDAAHKALEGKVASVGLQTSAATGALPVHVLIVNAGGRLRAGMMARVEITVGTVSDVLAVPDGAILASEEETTIAVVRGGKAIHLHPRVGLRRDGLMQVTVEGLAAGELVITRGAYDLPDGAAVKIEEEHEKEKKAEKDGAKEHAPGGADEKKDTEPEKKEDSKQ